MHLNKRDLQTAKANLLLRGKHHRPSNFDTTTTTKLNNNKEINTKPHKETNVVSDAGLICVNEPITKEQSKTINNNTFIASQKDFCQKKINKPTKKRKNTESSKNKSSNKKQYNIFDH